MLVLLPSAGDLDVLKVDVVQLPKGVSPGYLRMYAGHRNGEVRILDP
ncbi:hypothetical protein CGRA01v4_09101 [Colletotrichum graminicola]|nr:hypothetical protein CGRA01v4_09101 [Colletotrichum graminicola]